MANVHPEGHDSPNLDLGSHCSSMPSVNATDLDEEIMPRAEFLELKPNNHVYETEVRIRHPIVAEILKRHPLWTALNDSVQVPHIYVQQFWKHLEFHPDEGDHHFTSKIDHFDTSFGISKLRRLLGLPKSTDRPDKQDYDVFVSESQLLQDIRSLGYAQELTKISDFLKKFLPPIYYTLFSILNRCLTGKNSGIDSSSISMLTLFHGVVFDRHYDYAQLIFNEIEEAVAAKFKGKKDRRYLPFQRYLQRLVKSAMRRNPDIPRREQYQLGPVSHMQFVRYNNEQFRFEWPLLPEVVAYADQTVPCVQEYIRTHALMVRPRPLGPAHGANPSGEGIDVSRGLKHGVQDQGEQRENLIERGTGVGGTVTGFAAADVHTDIITTAEAGPSQIHLEREEILDTNEEVLKSEDLEEESDEEEDDNVYPSVTESEGESDREVNLEQPSSGDDESHDVDVHLIQRRAGPRPRDPLFDQSSSNEEEQPKTQATDFSLRVCDPPEQSEEESDKEIHHHDDVMDVDTTVNMAVSGAIRIEEGVLVENPTAILWARGGKEHGESEIRSKEHEDLLLTDTSWVATSTAGVHLLPPRIEEVVVDPATHSTAPQQVDVSHTHGEIAQTLSTSHSELIGIETDRHQPQPSISLPSTLSLDPIAQKNSLFRTQMTTTSVGNLSGPTGTFVVTSTIGVSQGSEGSPATTLSMPIVSAGTTVATTVGSMGSLSVPVQLVPSQLMHPENLLTTGLLSTRLKLVFDEYKKQVDSQKKMYENLNSEIQKLIKGKHVAQEPESIPAPPPPPPVQTQMSIDELKSMLMARLLLEGHNISSEEANLVTVLRSQAETLAQSRAQTVTKSDIQELKTLIESSTKSLQNSIDSLSGRVLKLEETCKAQANNNKRKHDDHDSDHHEGEKRLKLAESLEVHTKGITEEVQIEDV